MDVGAIGISTKGGVSVDDGPGKARQLTCLSEARNRQQIPASFMTERNQNPVSSSSESGSGSGSGSANEGISVLSWLWKSHDGGGPENMVSSVFLQGYKAGILRPSCSVWKSLEVNVQVKSTLQG